MKKQSFFISANFGNFSVLVFERNRNMMKKLLTFIPFLFTVIWSQTIQVVDQFHKDGLPKVVLHYVETNNRLELFQKTTYHANGQKKKDGTYFNGSKDGKWTEWREDGTRMEEKTYENGEKHGVWVHWGKNGKKLKEGKYVQDRKSVV